MKPNLKSKDRSKLYLKIAKNYANKISKHKGIIGITTGGGPAKGHADEFSDIDLYIYLDSKTYSRWQKKSPIPKGDHNWKKYWVETEFLDYNKEKNERWSVEDRWERNSHIILFDPKFKIKKLLKEKLVWNKKEKEQLSESVYGLAEWYGMELPKTWISRGDVMQAHFVLNKAINWIFDYIFLQNNYFIPFAKWKLHYVFLMKKLPKNFKKNIQKAMKIKEFNEKEVLRRQKVLTNILKSFKIYK